jgi:molybdenum cofactor biosynthesis enzyme MoaA
MTQGQVNRVVTPQKTNLGKYCVISIWFGCNNDCAICMLSNIKSDLPVIGFDRYKKVIVEIMQEGLFENLILSGAEVTTFPELEKYVRFAASLGWFKKIQIQTNGRRLSDRAYLERLIHCGVNEFFVSIHGFEKAHDNATRIQGTFHETLAGLRNLAAYDVNVISNTVLTRDNYLELPKLMDFLSGEGVREMHTWNYFPMEAADSRNLIVRLTELLPLLQELRVIMEKTGKALALKSFPLCLPAGSPIFWDSVFPVTVLPDRFWQEFSKSGFGKCLYRDAGQCASDECWGLSAAYMQKYGDERALLKPVSPCPSREGVSLAQPGNRNDRGIKENRQAEMGWIERVDAREVFYDFCLWEYQSLAPHVNKFSSATLLFHSFDVAGVNSRFFELVQAIRVGIGRSHTVWGIKWAGRHLKWEFYFYDYRRKDREISISKLLEVIRPYITCDIGANEHFHYFMFSLDIYDELISGAKSLDEVHIYIGNPGSTVSSGICYSLTKNTTQLENFYFFFDAKRQMKEIFSKAYCSAYIDAGISIDQIFWPEMRKCKIIVVANKQQNDSVYFSGININQLIFFLKRLHYPPELIAFMENNRSVLNHLQYDVGYDYRMEGGKLVILKSGYYGIF